MPINTIRFVVYDSYPGVYHQVNTRKNDSEMTIIPSLANEQISGISNHFYT